MRFQLIPNHHRTCIKGLQSKSEANQFLSLLFLQSAFIQGFTAWHWHFRSQVIKATEKKLKQSGIKHQIYNLVRKTRSKVWASG